MFGALNSSLFKKHLEDDEQVISVVHKHWVLGIKYLFWPVLLEVFLILVIISAPKLEVLYTVGALVFIVFIWMLRNFFDYFLDAWIITDSGIIDVEWHGWFHRQSSRVLFSDIQGVSYEIQGIINTIFRYGTISVEKVSTGNAISIDNVASPKGVEAIILNNMEEYLHKKNLKDAKAVQDILSNVISREMHLKEMDSDTSKK